MKASSKFSLLNCCVKSIENEWNKIDWQDQDLWEMETVAEEAEPQFVISYPFNDSKLVKDKGKVKIEDRRAFGIKLWSDVEDNKIEEKKVKIELKNELKVNDDNVDNNSMTINLPTNEWNNQVGQTDSNVKVTLSSLFEINDIFNRVRRRNLINHKINSTLKA